MRAEDIEDEAAARRAGVDDLRMATGYEVVPGPDGVATLGLRPQPLARLTRGFAQGQTAPVPDLQRAVTDEVQQDQVQAVVLARMAYDVQASAFVARLLGWPLRPVTLLARGSTTASSAALRERLDGPVGSGLRCRGGWMPSSSVPVAFLRGVSSPVGASR